MLTANIVLISFFCLVSIIHLLGEFLVEKKKDSAAFLRYVTKPLLMPLLILFYTINNSTINWWIIGALVGGFLGDLFLMIPDPKKKQKWLRIGLFSFLFGHIFYIVAFALYAQKFPYFRWWVIFLALPFVIAAVIIYPKMTKNIGKMKIPVTVYIIVICVMGISTTFLLIPLDSFPISMKMIYLSGIILVYLGAWFFAVSDTLNGIGKFVKQFKNERLFTMSTYLLGQFLLIFGYLLITSDIILTSL